jgi:hypothetical protein
MYWEADERGGWAGDGVLSGDIGSRAVRRPPERKKQTKSVLLLVGAVVSQEEDDSG